jgi:hypothetical protein
MMTSQEERGLRAYRVRNHLTQSIVSFENAEADSEECEPIPHYENRRLLQQVKLV